MISSTAPRRFSSMSAIRWVGASLADHIELGVLGAADLGHPAQRCARMDAEAGAADQAIDQTEVADEFGQARHQADDARHAGKAPVLAAERIDQRLIPQPLLQEKG
jgi:hypothetical protein